MQNMLLRNNELLSDSLEDKIEQIAELKSKLAGLEEPGVAARLVNSIVKVETRSLGLYFQSIDKFQVVVKYFLEAMTTKVLNNKTASTRHLLHMLSNDESTICVYPFMLFEIADTRYVLSATVSSEGIEMYYFLADDYEAVTRNLARHRLVGDEIVKGYTTRVLAPGSEPVIDKRKEVIKDSRHILRFANINTSGEVTHQNPAVVNARCGAAAETFITQFSQAFLGGHSRLVSSSNATPAIHVHEVCAHGVEFPLTGHGDDTSFNYDVSAPGGGFTLTSTKRWAVM